VINMQQFKATGPDGEQAGVTAPRPLIVVVTP